MDNVNGIISAFSNLRVNDTMVEKQAENDILEYMRHPESILSFMLHYYQLQTFPLYVSRPMLLMCVVPPNGRSLFEKEITIYWSMVDPDDQEMGSHLPNSVTL